MENLKKPPMGIGKLCNGNFTMSKRKFRWTIQIKDPDTDGIIVPRMFVKTNTRPEVVVDEIDFLNNKNFIPGRQSFNTIDLTIFDIDSNLTEDFIEYVTKLYNQGQALIPGIHMANYILELWDGCGSLIEGWNLKDGIITSIRLGEIDEPVSAEVSVRYKNVEYKNYCPSFLSGQASPNPLPEDGYNYGGAGRDNWKIPEEWVVRNPIRESSSPGEHILDQFLRRTTSK